jgi:hypothetical protein
MCSAGTAVSWIDRYRAGAHREVWREMTDAGPALRDDAEAWKDATEVVRETLRRVRDNIRLLHGTLASAGYRFACGDLALQAPSPDVRERLDEIERVVGPIPLLLKVWLEEVGSVNLIGTLPSWRFEYTDALVVECWIADVIDDHRDRQAFGWYEMAGTASYPLPLSPDYLHKVDVSGGPPYSIGLPNLGVDALWQDDALHPQTLFVDYLRSARLDWGGFPGWSRREPQWAAPQEPLPGVLTELAAEFERF